MQISRPLSLRPITMIVASGRRAWQKSMTRPLDVSRVTTAGDARHVLAFAPSGGVTVPQNVTGRTSPVHVGDESRGLTTPPRVQDASSSDEPPIKSGASHGEQPPEESNLLRRVASCGAEPPIFSPYGA